MADVYDRPLDKIRWVHPTADPGEPPEVTHGNGRPLRHVHTHDCEDNGGCRIAGRAASEDDQLWFADISRSTLPDLDGRHRGR